MTRAQVIANRRQYTVSGLDPRARGDVFQAVVIARLLDDFTGEPVAARITVSTDADGLRPRTSPDGYAGLVGVPSRVFTPLAAPPPLGVTFGAEGYAPRREEVSFVVPPGFPASFPARDLGDLVLRRDAAVVGVRTFELDPQERPVALGLAAVTVSGHWRTVAALAGAPATDALLAVGPGLSAPRPSGAAIDAPALTPAVEPARTLEVAAAPGALRLEISRTDALAAGDVVGVDAADPDRREWIEVVAIEGPQDPASPAVAVLRFPVRAAHSLGALVQRIPAPAPAPALSQTTADALAGDRTLFVTTLAGLPAGQPVRIAGGAAAPEFQVADRYDVTTDAQGFARMPALTGVAGIEVAASSGALAATVRLSLTRRSPTHGLDLTLV
jgi:hypothetical protein